MLTLLRSVLLIGLSLVVLCDNKPKINKDIKENDNNDKFSQISEQILQSFKDGFENIHYHLGIVYEKLKPGILFTIEKSKHVNKKLKPYAVNITNDAFELLLTVYDVLKTRLYHIQQSQLYKDATNLQKYENLTYEAIIFTKEWYNYVYYLSLEYADKFFDTVNTGVDKIKSNFEKSTDEL